MEIPNGVKLFAEEHGGLFELAVKGYKGEGNTLGYADGVRGRIPESTILVIEHSPEASTVDVLAFAEKLRNLNYRFAVIQAAGSGNNG